MLQVGDIIRLENGMCVYAMIPSKFVISNCKFSDELTSHNVEVGKVYHNDRDVRGAMNNIAKGIVERFEWEGATISFQEAKEFVIQKLPIPEASTFEVKPGEFLVVRTIEDGGGCDSYRPSESYPNGHHVFLKRLNDDGTYNENGQEVNFYESGSFTCVNENVVVVRKLNVTFV